MVKRKKLGILFSGGKDSIYAAFLAKKCGYDIGCLITIVSKNEDSYMFHTPSIRKVEEQAKVMGIPLVVVKTAGEKEKELVDLAKAISLAIKDYGVEGIVSGAVESVYQASRVEKICNKLNVECFNPLWQKDPEEYWNELLKNGFEIIITGVSAEGLDENWLGLEINKKNFKELKKICERYKIHLSFEGGEAETFVINCPLFKRKLKVSGGEINGEGISWRMEVSVK